LDESEKGFLSRTITGPCSSGEEIPDGWYADLYFGWLTSRKPAPTGRSDIVVADVHTSPTDEGGDMVGWVLHAGTGPLNMAFVVTTVPEVGDVAFVGPVSSYYEYVTSDFKRLTDEEWKAEYAGLIASRPSWANLFLANQSGNIREKGQTLVTGIVSDPAGAAMPQSVALAQNYPNPFNPSTKIRFELPQASRVSLKVFDVLGREVMTLVDEVIPAGVYYVRFDGSTLSSGVYFYRLQAGESVKTKRMILLK
jgi:hypothetical protein